MQPASDIVDALGVLLGRGFRVELYTELTDGIHDGFTASTYPALSGVARLGPISTTGLAVVIGLDRSVVSRVAGELVRDGLLESRRSEGDARIALLTLTSAGRTAIATSRRRLTAAVRRQIHSWSPEDQEAFAVLLARFTATERLGREEP